jgi:hypothetical protein
MINFRFSKKELITYQQYTELAVKSNRRLFEKDLDIFLYN